MNFQNKNEIYKEYENGFYVYAKPDNISSIKQSINYVVIYTGRPAMAQSRILNYDVQIPQTSINILLIIMKNMNMEKELNKCSENSNIQLNYLLDTIQQNVLVAEN